MNARSIPSMFRTAAPLLCALGLPVITGCQTGEVVWVDFSNGAAATVLVVAAQSDCDTAKVEEPEELLSDVVFEPVGSIAIDPLCGPVGTDHRMVVTVGLDWADVVGRATVEIVPEASTDIDGDGDPDSRGDLVFEMERDSAFGEQYGLTLQSQGEPGEARSDRFIFTLFQPEELDLAPQTDG